MKAVIKKWGNSAAVRLPAAIMEAAHLALEQEMDVREENGLIIIEPVSSTDISLAELVGGITPENSHDEVDFGPAMGREID
jgi:antitoxin MazE